MIVAAVLLLLPCLLYAQEQPVVVSADSVFSVFSAQSVDSVPSAGKKDTVRFVRERVDLDHVVQFNAKDSIILFGRNHAVMYGGSKLIYGDIDMTASQISMDMDSSQVQPSASLTASANSSATRCSRMPAASMSRG